MTNRLHNRRVNNCLTNTFQDWNFNHEITFALGRLMSNSNWTKETTKPKKSTLHLKQWQLPKGQALFLYSWSYETHAMAIDGSTVQMYDSLRSLLFCAKIIRCYPHLKLTKRVSCMNTAMTQTRLILSIFQTLEQLTPHEHRHLWALNGPLAIKNNWVMHVLGISDKEMSPRAQQLNYALRSMRVTLHMAAVKMATASEVLQLYRQMLRVGKSFSSYNYRWL